MPETGASAASCRREAENHLKNQLLPFWLTRCCDDANGGYLTHFDENGDDPGTDEKSLISQARTLYTMSSAHRAGYGEGDCARLARHGADFLLDKMLDRKHGGFYWLADRRGKILSEQKILYGQCFAMYALAEYTLATDDPRGIEAAVAIFDLVQEKCRDRQYGGYLEMFDRRWRPAGPGPQGGDRKTFDAHMHLMEALTTLFEATGDEKHRRALRQTIALLIGRMLHPEFGTAIAHFSLDWQPLPQIKFDVVWGHDRYNAGGRKAHAQEGTSFGHNLEFVWLLRQALLILDLDPQDYTGVMRPLTDHAVNHGIDHLHGGLFTEGGHAGGVLEEAKEFWQQAEALIGLLDACLAFGLKNYWPAYLNVHRFVFDKLIDRRVGEWRPLLTREGKPIWTHLGDSWKINYHTVRSMIQSIRRLDQLLESTDGALE